jgi:hypothetical protein
VLSRSCSSTLNGSAWEPFSIASWSSLVGYSAATGVRAGLLTVQSGFGRKWVTQKSVAPNGSCDFVVELGEELAAGSVVEIVGALGMQPRSVRP